MTMHTLDGLIFLHIKNKFIFFNKLHILKYSGFHRIKVVFISIIQFI